ncbi:MAG: 50S ribosomal protein L4 [Candidatus Zambryskibacteria bacterium]|nr:50S ribosomal protein L4 [Candidatus Zambryskibacteria bacterium]
MEAKIYNQEGKETGEIKLPLEVFGLSWNTKTERLVRQMVDSMMTNKRTGTAHAKIRGEVSGTGRKPWKQKGTGQARHGSRRSPIWIGGGVAHGPRADKNYSRKINKKMKVKALFSILSKKLSDGEIILIDNFVFKEPKAKEAKNILTSLTKIKGFDSLKGRKNACFLILGEKDNNILKSFGNFSNLKIGQVKDLNILDLLQYRNLIIVNPKKSIEILSLKLK